MLLDERPFTASRQPACCHHWSRPGDDLSVGDGEADGSGFLRGSGAQGSARQQVSRSSDRSPAPRLSRLGHRCSKRSRPADTLALLMLRHRHDIWVTSFGTMPRQTQTAGPLPDGICSAHAMCVHLSRLGRLRTKRDPFNILFGLSLDLLQIMCLGSVRWMHASTMHGVAFGPCRPAMSVLKLKHRHEDRDCDVTSCQDPRPGRV